jgi:hypothetical protein
MYINVIYFLVKRGTFVHTVFEPVTKKHLPFFSRFRKKSPFFAEATIWYLMLAVDVCVGISLSKAQTLYDSTVTGMDPASSILFQESLPKLKEEF